MEDISRSSEYGRSYLQSLGNSGTSEISQKTNPNVSSLPSFGSISQPHQDDDQQRDILMPIQQNVIGSSSNFHVAQIKTNGSMSPLSKSNSSLFGSRSSSVFSTSSDETVPTDSRGTILSKLFDIGKIH